MIDNKLLKNTPPSLVQVAHGSGPYANTREALKGIDLTQVQGKRVLLKPNVGRAAQPGQGITTHPEVVAAAIDVFRDAGADVAIGESPITGVDVMEAFAEAGITAVAEARDCPLIDMDRRPFIDVEIPQAKVLQEFSHPLCAEGKQKGMMWN